MTIPKNIKILMFSMMIGITIFVVIWNSYQYPSRIEKFHKKEFKGILTYIYSGSGGTRISINKESEKHLIFTEYNDSIESFFYRFVTIGDSIYKAPYDKHIHVFKENNEYLFETTKE